MAAGWAVSPPAHYNPLQTGDPLNCPGWCIKATDPLGRRWNWWRERHRRGSWGSTYGGRTTLQILACETRATCKQRGSASKRSATCGWPFGDGDMAALAGTRHWAHAEQWIPIWQVAKWLANTGVLRGQVTQGLQVGSHPLPILRVPDLKGCPMKIPKYRAGAKPARWRRTEGAGTFTFPLRRFCLVRHCYAMLADRCGAWRLAPMVLGIGWTWPFALGGSQTSCLYRNTSQTLHVCNICLHWPPGTTPTDRHIWHTWSIWAL